MNCSACGTPLPPNATQCPKCGALTPYYYSSLGTVSGSGEAAPTIPSYSTAPPPPSTGYGSPPYGAAPTDPYSSPPPAGYSPYGPPVPVPIVAPPSQPPRRNVGLIAGIIILVILLIGGGIFILFSSISAHNASIQATVTAQARANALATAHVIATATAATQNPYTHSGSLAFTDPLSDNTKGHNWDENPTNCAFTGGAYHAKAPDPRYSDYCIAQNTDFSNFVFEVQVQIIQGDAAGIIFRVESTSPANQLYAFYFGQDGSYFLNMQNGSNYPVIAQGTSPAIHTGLNQVNLIAVEANGSSITLFINHQALKTITDTTYTHGKIGVIASPLINAAHATEAVFTNARVWTI